MPVSFSTCTINTVRSGSAAFKCRMKAVKARMSASSEARANGEGESTRSPFLLTTWAYRSVSSFIHSGM